MSTREGENSQEKSLAKTFAAALSCLDDAACWLRRIDDQYLEIYPNDECEEPEVVFWWGIQDAIKPLEHIQEKLEAIADCVPEVTA